MTHIYMIDNIKLREVNKIKLNVVGSFANKEEIQEIETVAKAFIIAQRMIYITQNIDNKKLSESVIKPPKKPVISYPSNPIPIRLLTVKGFN